MSFSNNMDTLSLPASADLSTKQYRCVTVNSSGQVAVSDATTLVVGVLINKPTAAGQAATVTWSGVTKVIAGGTIAAGARVTSDANGAAIAASAAGDSVLGVALAGAASGDIVAVLVNPYPFATLA